MNGRIPSHLRPGKGLWQDGSYYNILSVKEEKNGEFAWYSIEAVWSHMGPMPYFHRDKKTFLIGRRRISTGEFV